MDTGSKRQAAAQRAMGDPLASIAAHGQQIEGFNVDIRRNGTIQNRSAALAATMGSLLACAGLGSVMQAATSSSTSASSLSITVSDLLKVVHGAALRGIIAGCSVAVVATMACAAEREVYDLELEREMWEIDNHMEGECGEMYTIYEAIGLSRSDAKVVTSIFAKQKDIFAQLMMVEELGYTRIPPPTTRDALRHAALPAVVGCVLGVITSFSPVLLYLCCRRHAPCTSSVSPSHLALLSGAGVAVGSLGSGWVRSHVFFGSYAQASTVMRKTAVSVVCSMGLFCAGWWCRRASMV